MSARLVILGVLALLFMTMWRFARAMGAEPQALLLVMALSILPGMLTALLVLAMSKHSKPEPEAKESAWRPESEDDAPWLEWPEPPAGMSATSLLTDDEEFLDEPEPPVVMLWRMRRLQEDARRRGWPCPDVDAWLERNAERIEAECLAKYAALGVAHG